ncbi:restriction endonuclease subunit S [Photobacterium leiognathi]|uniref:restriction endonuclease subunit S n=1 Tax=Photobacterium leiognathi TaxID=553611 RepID=UPI002981CC70|nr:restriction endonuclease subunit S [Photobacterium leiognathi]
MVPNSISKLDLVQAQISEIPEGWQLCKVSEALRIRNNFRKPISQEVRETMKGQYPYYGPTKIQDYISEYEQDGIYALIGEDGDHFLKYATMPQTQFISGKCTVNNHAHILESSSICDSEWFFNYFKHRNITNFLSRQGAGRFKLNKATLEKLPLLVPPLPEQRKIAQILSTWDRGIATTEKLIDASKQQKKALMQQLLTGNKRLVDPETGKAFQGEWEEVKLNQIANITMGSSPKSESYNEVGIGLPLLQGNADIKARKSAPRIYTSQITKECNVNDILLSVRAPVGTVAKSLHNACIGRGIASIQAKKNIVQEFVYQWLLAFEPKWERFSQGSTFEAVNSNDIKTLHISLPVFQEQQKIASVLTGADKEIELLEAKLAHFKQEKKALMQQLLTGKRRVSLSS